MRLIQTTPVAAFPVADRSRDGELYETEHPRLAAIRHLREAIADRRAGLDPYDPSIFLFDANPNELVWAAAVVNLTGLLLDVAGDGNSGRRYRIILEADVRQELGLDRFAAPRLTDEPLASRRVDSTIEEGLRLLENPKTPVIRAIADARDAQRRADDERALAENDEQRDYAEERYNADLLGEGGQ